MRKNIITSATTKEQKIREQMNAVLSEYNIKLGPGTKRSALTERNLKILKQNALKFPNTFKRQKDDFMRSIRSNNQVAENLANSGASDGEINDTLADLVEMDKI